MPPVTRHGDAKPRSLNDPGSAEPMRQESRPIVRFTIFAPPGAVRTRSDGSSTCRLRKPGSGCQMVVMGARILTVAVLFVALAAFAPSARASTTIDIRGDWAEQSHFGGTSSYVMHWNAENFSSGAVSGTGGQPGADQWSMTGTINGNHVVYTEVYYGLSYTSTEDVTVAADGNSYSGTFHGSNNVTGTITATRTSGPPSSGGPPPSTGGAKRPTGVAVI